MTVRPALARRFEEASTAVEAAVAAALLATVLVPTAGLAAYLAAEREAEALAEATALAERAVETAPAGPAAAPRTWTEGRFRVHLDAEHAGGLVRLRATVVRARTGRVLVTLETAVYRLDDVLSVALP